MNRHPTHQTGDKAEIILRDTLPIKWLINKQESDYGKDFIVETSDEQNNLTGISFFVQLKGHERFRLDRQNTAVSFSLRKKHAEYYLDKVKDLPLFLILIDVNTRKGYWAFLQPILDCDQKWRKHGTIRIAVPLKNDLADTAKLTRTIEHANQWMRVNHPTAVFDAIQAQKQKLEKLDPRFRVKVSINENRQFIEFEAVEAVELTFNAIGDKAQKAWQEFVDKGAEVIFGPGEWLIEGSKLFESQLEGQLSVKPTGSPQEATCSLDLYDAAGLCIASLSDVPGAIAGGVKESRYEGGLPRSAFAISINPIGSHFASCNVKLQVWFDKWNGQHIGQLAYFDRICEWFEKGQQATQCKIAMHIDGNLLTSGRVPDLMLDKMATTLWMLQVLKKLRRIAKHFGKNPVFRIQDIDRELIGDVEQLHAVIFEGGWVCNMPNMRMSFNANVVKFRHDLIKEPRKPSAFRIIQDEQWHFLGEQWNIGCIVRDYSHVNLQVNQLSKSGDEERVEMVLTASDENVTTFRLATPEDT